MALVVFALVVAYPYIPGSESAAFKGISLFLGLVSLGSSSAISNIIAGYTMTYRRLFRRGDRVKIGEVTGLVTEVRLQVTHIRTPKNEEAVIPNSTILNSEVINYSTMAKSEGLILHTTVSESATRPPGGRSRRCCSSPPSAPRGSPPAGSTSCCRRRWETSRSPTS